MGEEKHVTMVMATKNCINCCIVYLISAFLYQIVLRAAKIFLMSRQNTTFWPKVGKMGIGETGVGEQGISCWVNLGCCYRATAHMHI